MRKIKILLCFLFLFFSVIFSIKLEDNYNQKILKSFDLKIPNVPRYYDVFHKYTYSEYEYSIGICTESDGRIFHCYSRFKCSYGEEVEDYCIPNGSNIRIKALPYSIYGCFLQDQYKIVINREIIENYDTEIVGSENISVREIKLPNIIKSDILQNIQPPK